jgi:hypothetical protein
MTSLACQVGGSLARNQEHTLRVIFIDIFTIDGVIDYGD